MTDDPEEPRRVLGLPIPAGRGLRTGEEEQRVLGFPQSWLKRPARRGPGGLLATVRATDPERQAARPGDQLVDPADVVMDRAFTVAAAPEEVWPWLLQLGKRRAGWYLPARAERFLPAGRRAARSLNRAWLRLQAGDVIPDYGGRNATFEVAQISPPHSLVYRSRRGGTSVSWSLTLEPAGADGSSTRVLARLRLAPVRHLLLARTAGELVDKLTIAGMAAGLRERVAGQPRADG
jgi:Polyketide cyclase / dehydrase and lipid transport